MQCALVGPLTEQSFCLLTSGTSTDSSTELFGMRASPRGSKHDLPQQRLCRLLTPDSSASSYVELLIMRSSPVDAKYTLAQEPMPSADVRPSTGRNVESLGGLLRIQEQAFWRGAMLSSTLYATGSIVRGVCELVAGKSIVCRLLLLEEQGGGMRRRRRPSGRHCQL